MRILPLAVLLLITGCAASQPVQQPPVAVAPTSAAPNPDLLACQLMPLHTQPVASALQQVGSRTMAISDLLPVLAEHGKKLRYNGDAAAPGGAVQQAAYALGDTMLRVRVDLMQGDSAAVTSDTAAVASGLDRLDAACTSVGASIQR